VGSKTRRTSSSSPADAISKRVQALVKENQRLREQVSQLEKSWKKLEKALGSNATRARRAVRKAIDDVTG
jgi:cell division septum initiation protein DivIVA